MNKSILIILILILGRVSYSQENFKVKKIKFKGNSAFNDLKLKEHLTLQPSSYIKEKIFKKDPVNYTKSLYLDDVKRLTQFYQKEGYLNFKCLEPEIEIIKNKKIKLIFHVVEGEPIEVASINYTVDSVLSISESLPKAEQRIIRLRSKLRANNTFRDQWCIEDQQLLNEQFSNIGYAYAHSTYSINVDTITSEAVVEWNINRGKLAHFGETFVTGHDKVPEKKIRKQLTYEAGDVWSKKDIDLTQKRIYNLGMFRVSSLRTIIGEERRDTLPIQINIKEAPRWTTRFGVGYGRDDKFRIFGELQKLGFISKTGRVNLYAKHSALEPYNFFLRFTQPAVFFPINSLIIHPFVQKQNEPGYTLENTGLNFTFFQNFSDNFNSNVTLFYEDIQQDTTNVDALVEEDLPESLYSKSGISFGFSLLNGEPKLDPIRGFSLAFNIKTNGLYMTREMPFHRSLLEFKKYWGLSYGLTFAFKGKIGLAQATDGSGYLPPEERFYAGGGHSVRGWSRSDLGPKDSYGKPLGGKSLLEGSAEVRAKLTQKLIFAIFLDAGNVWTESFDYHLNDLGYSAGVGLRYSTPIGPAGIDVAKPIFNEKKSWQIHINIGHPF